MTMQIPPTPVRIAAFQGSRPDGFHPHEFPNHDQAAEDELPVMGLTMSLPEVACAAAAIFATIVLVLAGA